MNDDEILERIYDYSAKKLVAPTVVLENMLATDLMGSEQYRRLLKRIEADSAI